LNFEFKEGNLMKLATTVQAGSEKRSDVLVIVSPADGLTVQLQAKPIILWQFGQRIESVVRQVAQEEDVDGACIQVKDGGGALDFAIRARVRCALRRAKGDVKDE
jgi:citrate lyase acyl carrier protein